MNPREIFKEAQAADQILAERLGWNARMGVAPNFKREPVTRENLQKQGMILWPHSFAKVGEDDIAGALRGMLEAATNEHMALILRTPMGQVACFAAARWAHYGFPIVQYGNHRYAAALMATKVPEGEVLPPWKTFLIELPTGLLRTRGADGEYDDLAYCMVNHHTFIKTVDGQETPVQGWTYDTYTRDGVNLSNHRQTTDELRNGTGDRLFDDDSPFAYDLADEDTRTLSLISRLVLNTCMAMSNPEVVRPIGKHPKNHTVGFPRNAKERAIGGSKPAGQGFRTGGLPGSNPTGRVPRMLPSLSGASR